MQTRANYKKQQPRAPGENMHIFASIIKACTRDFVYMILIEELKQRLLAEGLESTDDQEFVKRRQGKSNVVYDVEKSK